jgi:UDP-3-O-[3-hydroxymyristoyl] glucosamine N-acyltransferase
MIKHSKNKSISLEELAKLTGGQLLGSCREKIAGVAPITSAKENEITFLSGAKNYSKHLKSLESSKACAVIAPEDAPDLNLPSIRLKNSYEGLVQVLNFFQPERKPSPGIHPTAFVSEDATVSKDAVVGPLAVVEAGAKVAANAWVEAKAYVGRNATVGANTRLYPHVSLLDDCIVGDNCIIHSGTVIGSDGFGFTPVDGVHVKVPQIGNVIIEDNVEIGSNVSIDRATMESTIVGEGTKIDNMVHLAHNVIVGKKCIIVGQVGISGSTVLEDYVTMAGQTGTVGHVTIGKGTTVAARGVVTNDVPANSFVSGFPVKPHSEERKIIAAMRRLPELLKKVRSLEKKLEEKD